MNQTSNPARLDLIIMKCKSCGLEGDNELFVPTYRKEGEYRSKCLSCHRRESNIYRQKHRDKRKEIILTAKNKPCADCGVKYPYYVMDFDHVEGKKEFNISDGFYNASLEDIKNEITKCDVVCSNCHRERTHNRI